jgi:hypothetical protein
MASLARQWTARPAPAKQAASRRASFKPRPVLGTPPRRPLGPASAAQPHMLQPPSPPAAGAAGARQRMPAELPNSNGAPHKTFDFNRQWCVAPTQTLWGPAACTPLPNDRWPAGLGVFSPI